MRSIGAMLCLVMGCGSQVATARRIEPEPAESTEPDADEHAQQRPDQQHTAHEPAEAPAAPQAAASPAVPEVAPTTITLGECTLGEPQPIAEAPTRRVELLHQSLRGNHTIIATHSVNDARIYAFADATSPPVVSEPFPLGHSNGIDRVFATNDGLLVVSVGRTRRAQNQFVFSHIHPSTGANLEPPVRISVAANVQPSHYFESNGDYYVVGWDARWNTPHLTQVSTRPLQVNVDDGLNGCPLWDDNEHKPWLTAMDGDDLAILLDCVDERSRHRWRVHYPFNHERPDRPVRFAGEGWPEAMVADGDVLVVRATMSRHRTRIYRVLPDNEVQSQVLSEDDALPSGFVRRRRSGWSSLALRSDPRPNYRDPRRMHVLVQDTGQRLELGVFDRHERSVLSPEGHFVVYSERTGNNTQVFMRRIECEELVSQR